MAPEVYPLADSAVVVTGNRIVEAGPRNAANIPGNSDKIDGFGKYLIPALVDAYKGPGPAAPPSTPEQARAQVAEQATRKPTQSICGWISCRMPSPKPCWTPPAPPASPSPVTP